MESPIQEDPYHSLGVAQSATAGDIKSAYRKLALRCHPDKVTDEAQKKQKADEFHKIQQAYELLSNDESRSRYDARLRLAELKAEMMRRDSGRGMGSSSYEVRPPPPQSFPSYRSGQYEVRTPKYAEEFVPETRSSTRKHSDAGAYFRRTAPETAKTEEKRRTEKMDKARSERRRERHADIRDSRDRKYYSSSENVNDRSQFEEERKKRDDVVKQREDEAMRRRFTEETGRRRSDDSRRPKASYESVNSPRPSFDMPDYSRNLAEARRYQESANLSNNRPQPVRTSSKDDYSIRRSRAKGESRRRSPEIVEPPSLNKSATTGHRDYLREMINEGGRMPERSYSDNFAADTHDKFAPPPLSRNATMPVIGKESSRKDPKSSRQRPEIKIPDSGYSSPNAVTPDQAYPNATAGTVPPTPKVSSYRYTPANVVTGDYVTSSPDSYAAPYTGLETRTPKADKERSDRRRGRDGSVDMPRPPMGARAGSYSREEVPRRPSYTTRDSERERERERDRSDRRRRERDMLYGEVPSEYTKKNSVRSKDYRTDDLRSRDAYMRSGRDRSYEDREFIRPSMSRSNTLAAM